MIGAEHEPGGTAPARGDDTFAPVPLNRGVSFRDCVRNAMKSYFDALGEHEGSGLFSLVMSEVEGPLLEAVLEHSGGNQAKAARMLGISPGTLRKKLRQYRPG